jgi:tubulin--tyrosine ligase
MHILVTNDDGPPSTQASPYVLPFVQTLEAAGHTVSVIVPHTQRSWIGKAHIVGQDVQATQYYPPDSSPNEHIEGSSNESNGKYPWVLVNSTPAACSQLASCFFEDRGPVDLVISGPNYGRNTSALFALSSGTLGAALEARQCGYHAIALSFAFFDRSNPADVVDESCRQSLRICEWLAKNANWDNATLYSVRYKI